MNYYSFEELKAQALAPNATQEAIEELNDWFSEHGYMYWNGEYFEIDDNHRLYHVFTETDDGELEYSHSEIR